MDCICGKKCHPSLIFGINNIQYCGQKCFTIAVNENWKRIKSKQSLDIKFKSLNL
jgi:hypothetical protein